MSSLTIECPECAGDVEVEEAMLGQRLKCPKCKESFIADIAEKGGLYDFVEDAKPKASSPPSTPAPAPRKGNPSRAQPARLAGDEASSDALSDEKKSDLLSSMEKWAEE